MLRQHSESWIQSFKACDWKKIYFQHVCECFFFIVFEHYAPFTTTCILNYFACFIQCHCGFLIMYNATSIWNFYLIRFSILTESEYDFSFTNHNLHLLICALSSAVCAH